MNVEYATQEERQITVAAEATMALAAAPAVAAAAALEYMMGGRALKTNWQQFIFFDKNCCNNQPISNRI